VKLLFSSSDLPEVALVKRLLVYAGIRCEIRHQDLPAALPETPVYPELWIQDEEDFLAASMLLASRRRRPRSMSNHAG
jgi:hypothetical protein